jgi:hypothetical protein
MRRERRNPQTGQIEREVWVQGQGYLPEGSIAALPTEDRQDLQSARANLGIARTNARLADQFVDANQETPTGGLNVRNWGILPQELQDEGRQRLEGLTNQMVRANIREGTSGTLNSIIEQMLARQQYPTAQTHGGVNVDRGIQMAVDEQEILAMLDEAERWARNPRNRGLQGFDVYWTRERSRQVRAEAERRIRADQTRPYRPRRTQGAQADAPPSGIDAREWQAMTPQERQRVREIMGQ